MRDPFRGYDQWKTASPYDDCPDDEHCHFCGYELTFGDNDDGTEPQWNGFCCKECQEDYKAGKKGLICIRPMYNLLCEELDPNPMLWEKRVCKGTDCGAWFTVPDYNEIEMGSIVEGTDLSTELQTLTWPFTKEDFWNALQRIEDDASYIWNETHGCEECAKLWGYIDTDGLSIEGCDGITPVHPDCKVCKGFGVII